MATGVILAKKKASKPVDSGEPTPSGEPNQSDRPKVDRSEFVKIRVSAAYKGWIGRFAESERSDMSDLFDDAMTAYARSQGFEPPPKR